MGTAALGDGLLLLHGAGSRAQVWQNQLLAFPRARAVDLPGRAGGAPAGVDGFLQALRRALFGEGDAHGRGGARIVAGHSLGGAIALRWALAHPDEVRALVLVGTGARLRVAPHILEGVRAADPAAIEQFGAMWFGPGTPPRLRERSLALLRATPPAVLAADLEAADRFGAMAELDRLRLPVLIICGAEDVVTPVKYSRYLHDRIGGSNLAIIEGAGHMVMLEQPQAVNRATQAFLERLDLERLDLERLDLERPDSEQAGGEAEDARGS